MKNYLSAIEKILGIRLEPGLVRNYAFSTATLKGLRDFASGYAKIRVILPDNELKISCFIPFPEIVSGDFRTYSTDGSLKNHWPAFDELANMLIISDRVIIHDHLEHYAGSAIDGYSVDHRYDGLRNWLLALAEWKPLILSDIICILPQYLALSGPLQSLWEEGTLLNAAADIHYEMYPGSGDIENGCDADDLLSDFREMEDFLTMLSIPFNRGGKYAHFYNNPETSGLHESTVDAAFRLFSRKAVLAGDRAVSPLNLENNGNLAHLRLDAVFSSPGNTVEEVCRFRLGSEETGAVRESIFKIMKKFAENSAFLADTSSGFQGFLDQVKDEIGEKLAGAVKSIPAGKQGRKQITIGFAGMVTGLSPEKYLAPEFLVIRGLLNNLPVKARLPGSICHYYLSLTDKK